MPAFTYFVGFHSAVLLIGETAEQSRTVYQYTRSCRLFSYFFPSGRLVGLDALRRENKAKLEAQKQDAVKQEGYDATTSYSNIFGLVRKDGESHYIVLTIFCICMFVI